MELATAVWVALLRDTTGSVIVPWVGLPNPSTPVRQPSRPPESNQFRHHETLALPPPSTSSTSSFSGRSRSKKSTGSTSPILTRRQRGTDRVVNVRIASGLSPMRVARLSLIGSAGLLATDRHDPVDRAIGTRR